MAISKKVKYGIGGTVVVVALAWMVFTGISQNMVYFLKVNEFLAKGSKMYGRNVRLNGKVAKGTVHKTIESGKVRYQFKITDGKDFIKIDYKGVVPDTFEEEKEVIVEGKYSEATRVFTATKLMTKCPSKYDQADTPEVAAQKKKMKQR
ncbi:MAG: cytochrome c maturation protein CcmE [bacterium]